MIKFLAACALVEDKAAEIYRAMAATALAEKNQELAALWLQMAADEEDHAQQVRLAARLSREKIFVELKMDREETPFASLERIETLLKEVTSTRLNEPEMLRVAVELESHFHKVHTSYTILFQDPSMKKMFDALARADDKHLAGLKDRIGKFPGDLSR
ncbi:MAG: ferritin family protein [Desulfuromonadales bacterium]